jgi:nucleotide-binding universal stress UspA family protein
MRDIISNSLVGVDFSEGSTMALRHAGQLALQTGARLHRLHVDGKVPPLMPSPLAGLSVEAYTQHLNASVLEPVR